MKIVPQTQQSIGASRNAAILLTVVLAGSMTACGGGGHRASRQDNTPAAAPRTPASSPASTAGDRSTAQKLLLTSADFPAGWKPAGAEDAPAPLSWGFLETHTYTAKASGRGFKKSDQTVASAVQIVRPGEDLTMDVAALRSPEFTRSLKSEMAKAIEQGNPAAASGRVTVKPLNIAKYGQYSFGYRSTMKITMQGLGIVFYEDSVWLVKGRISVAISFTGTDRPFDPALQKKLIAQLGTRLMATG